MNHAYYVTAPGKMTIVFGGPHGLLHALKFADMSRRCNVDGVRVGWMQGAAT